MELYNKGSRGYMVKQIQQALAGAGWKVIVDGIYGDITAEAVREFQFQHHLAADGVVGPKTLALLLPFRFKKSKRTITEIIIHCTATPEGKDFTVDQIRQDHIKNRGFSDIGYHYVIYRDGSVHNGRDVDTIGAHCKGHNATSIGIAYVGGLEFIPNTEYEKLPPKDTRTLAQVTALIDLLKQLKKNYPQAIIWGHRDFANKACPCFNAHREYQRI